MKENKILIITYDWPPRNSIACHRPYSWAKYFSNRGFNVTILTAEKQLYDYPLDLNLECIEKVEVITLKFPNEFNKFNLINKLNKNSKFFLFFRNLNNLIKTFFGIDIDPRLWWSNAILLGKFKIKGDFDYVISTYGPQSAHYIAAHLKSQNNKIKWIADYRDLWSISHLSNLPLWKKKSLMQKEYNLLFGKADLVTTVSEELAIDLRKFLNIKTEVILNGFDINNDLLYENFKKKKIEKKSLITIVYTGMIYIGRRDPSPLFQAISELGTDNIVVEFYGSSSDTIFDLFKGTLPKFIRCNGYVNREMSLELQKSADYVLLLESSNEDARGVLTGKVFEYISSGTPIMSIGSKRDSAIGKLLNYTNTGKCFENNLIELKQELLNSQVMANPDWYQPDITKIMEFSRDNQSRLFLNLIKNL
jgi:hypothetical protein